VSEQSEGPTLAAYAEAHGLHHRLFSAALPKATQLMRHGFLQEVPSVARGDLGGGLDDAWLAFASYAYEGRSDIERSRFTLVLIEAPKSLGFAVRVLCHDRDLSERDAANPDADREVIELDDRMVTLESEEFLRRYALSTDHDQDQLAVWQLFGPGLIDWLTDGAPEDFSFELQDGALCCFLPGFVTDPALLDALRAAAGRVFGALSAIERERGEPSGADGTLSRDETLEKELADHVFSEPPKSTKAAAKEFRRGPLLGEKAWKLGSEAFFREHAKALGFSPIDVATFRAGHVQTALPGLLAHVAEGSLPGIGVAGYLIFTDNADYDDMGWSSLITEAVPAAQAMALVASTPRADTAKRGSIQPGADGRTLFLSALDGGRRDRSESELTEFIAAAGTILARLAPG
jgi:hypothetical protein